MISTGANCAFLYYTDFMCYATSYEPVEASPIVYMLSLLVSHHIQDSCTSLYSMKQYGYQD